MIVVLMCSRPISDQGRTKICDHVHEQLKAKKPIMLPEGIDIRFYSESELNHIDS